MRIALWIGVLLFAVGMATYFATQSKYGRIDWTPLSLALPLSAGTTTSQQFRTTPGRLYDIVIDVNGQPDKQQKARCLLGATFDPEKDCPNIATVVDASWRILESGRVAANGDSNWTNGGNNVERLIGEFRAGGKGPYVLEFTTRKDAAALAPYYPKLNVIIDLFERDGLAMGQTISRLTALLVAAAGGATLFIRLIGMRVRARRERTEM